MKRPRRSAASVPDAGTAQRSSTRKRTLKVPQEAPGAFDSPGRRPAAAARGGACSAGARAAAGGPESTSRAHQGRKRQKPGGSAVVLAGTASNYKQETAKITFEGLQKDMLLQAFWKDDATWCAMVTRTRRARARHPVQPPTNTYMYKLSSQLPA